jgi:DMSO/TMAO reductase YedYZ molybdopterin-dependent catalytic subunit
MRRLSLSVAIALLAGFPARAAAPEPSLLQVTGALPRTGALKLAELEAMNPVKASWSGHGTPREVYGVPLERVLTRFGFEAGPMDKSPGDKLRGWRKVVVASAPDGFQAVLSCAEIFESLGATRAIIVWKIDGKPLGDAGPLRLVVLTDKQALRSVRNLARLEIVDLGASKPPAR